MYRRPASRYKRTPYVKKREEELEESPILVHAEEIPMPNEADIPPLLPNNGETDRIGSLGSFRFFGHDFFLDDLILIGLLLILLQENVQDELLLIVIVYIFLF